MANLSDIITPSNLATRTGTETLTNKTLEAGILTGATTMAGAAISAPITNTGAQIQWAKGADVASAAALPVLTDGNYFDVTGTTTITSINTTAIGNAVILHFDGILTLTHHATDLVLPGGANITTAAGDEATFVEYATGDYRCINYSKASGTSVVSPPAGTRVFISEVVTSGGSEVEFLSGIGSTYDTYVFEIVGLYRTDTATTRLVAQLYSGGAYIAGTSYLTTLIISTLGSTSYSALGYINQANAKLTNTASIPASSDANSYNSEVVLTGVNVGRANLRTRALSNQDNVQMDSNTNIYGDTITGIKFYLDAGTMEGTIRMFGLAQE